MLLLLVAGQIQYQYSISNINSLRLALHLYHSSYRGLRQSSVPLPSLPTHPPKGRTCEESPTISSSRDLVHPLSCIGRNTGASLGLRLESHTACFRNCSGNDRPRFRTASKAQLENSPESTSPLRAGQSVLCTHNFPLCGSPHVAVCAEM